MLKRNPKSFSKKPDEKNTDNGGPDQENSFEDEPFEPIHYDLNELLKGITPEQMQEEISTGSPVGKEIF